MYLCKQRIPIIMIPHEEYGRINNNEEDCFEKVPTILIVVAIVLLSIVGIYIVFKAIYGL